MSPLAFSDAERAELARLTEEGVALVSDKLGRLSGTAWNLVTSSVEEVPADLVGASLLREASSCVGAFLFSQSLLPIDVLVLFPEQCAARLTEAVVKASGGVLAKLPDPQAAVFKELSNILGQGVLKVLANSLKISLILSSPRFLRGPKAEAVARVLAAAKARNAFIVLRVDMTSAASSAECGMVLLFDALPMRQLLKNAAAARP
ncbi:MAG TPA: hypothetical protein DCM05_14300 [Elusimicrobia bacterium]|nr:hypothetical protein [Elusimicrobiota bacterium]